MFEITDYDGPRGPYIAIDGKACEPSAEAIRAVSLNAALLASHQRARAQFFADAREAAKRLRPVV